MKLKELAIDGFGAHRNLHLCHFNDGLTIVYGENGAGKTAIREFVRGTLFGFTTNQTVSNHPFSAGHLNVSHGAQEYQISRDSQPNSDVDIRLLSGSAAGVGNSLSQIAGGLNSDVYNAVFSVSFRETPTNVFQMTSVLQNHLGVPSGPEAAGDDSAYLSWKRESNLRRDRLDALRIRLDAATHERNGYVSQIESAKTNRQNQLASLDLQIASVASQMNEIQGGLYQRQLSEIDAEIASLRVVIDASTPVAYVAPQPPTIELHTSLYQRLDELDNQIRRWRHVQSDIQNQRVRLRDEMLVWNELTLDSDAHPYHNARAILVALESKVDEAERNANHWGDASASRLDTSQLAQSLGQLCQSMRDDLYGLCNELSQQYKHIRHKSAAAELKQLRRCYTEMGENIERLIQRRDGVIRDLREFDPAGADAILRSENKFCECAQHAGYLEARRRFIGEVSTSAPFVNVQPTPPAYVAERERLAILERQRVEVAGLAAKYELGRNQLKQRHADLVRQRDGLLGEVTFNELHLKIQTLDVEIQTLTHELNTLAVQVDQDSSYVAVKPNHLLQRAGDLLTRISNGDLTQVFLSDPFVSTRNEAQIELQVRDRQGKVLNFSAIDAGLQDQVYLCLMLAAKEILSQQGIEVPTLIDDAFCRVPADRATPTLTVMSEFAGLGQQIVAFTQHRYLSERVPGIPLLEIPPNTNASYTPVAPAVAPIPVAPIPVAPIQITPVQAPSATHTHEAYANDSLPRPYPLSKYPRTNSDYVADDRSYSVTYPFPNPGVQQGPDYLDPTMLGSAKFDTAADVNHRSITTVSVESVGDRLGYASGIGEETRLDKVGFFDSEQLRNFRTFGIECVADLLSINWNESPALDFHPDQLDRWQSQLWLLINLPGIRLNDARVLVACGVTEPDQLDTAHPQQIFERIERFFATSEGRRFAGSGNMISLDRISGWYRALDATRTRWQGRRRSSYSGNRQSDRGERQAFNRTHIPKQSHERPQERPRNERESRPARDRYDREPRSNRAPRVARPPRMNASRPERNVAPRVAPAKLVSEKVANPKPAKTKPKSAKKLKFYLDLSDHIEAAPAIGPKTAERFEKIGVQTVTNFLKQTAESMATKINYKRITAELIRQWQHQARLVCRIPNLRGHDAQLLVACGVTEPEELSTMQPKSLLDIVGPFSDTKEGLKIIRNGKKPDLAEITDWISWAEHTRSLQAA